MSQWIFLKSSCGSNAGNKTPASLVNGVVNNSVFHSNSHISQMLHHIIHILHFCLEDSLLNHVPDFVISWIEVTNLEVHRGDHNLLRLSHFPSGGSKWRTTYCLGKHSMRKRLQPEESIKTDAAYITNRFRRWKKPNNLVYELTTDKLLPVLINVLFGSIFEH